MRRILQITVLLLLLAGTKGTFAQEVRLGTTDLTLNYLNPVEYVVGGITFSGASCDVRNLPFAVGDKIFVD